MTERGTEATGKKSLIEHEPAWRFLLAAELAIVLATSNFLLLNEHSALELDSALALIGLCATGAAFSAFYLWRNRYWRAVLQALFVFLAIDLIGNDIRVAAIATSVTAAVVILSGRSLLLPASVFLGAMLASSVSQIGAIAPFKSVQTKPQKAADATKPAILHLILDEHIGIDGLQNPDKDTAETRLRLSQSYTSLGFRVYDRAFSQHLHTVNALPWVTNFGEPSKNKSGKGGARIRENRYFDSLHQAGFRINVVQTAFANFCANPNVATCTTYNQQSLGALRPYHLSNLDRAKVIYFKVLDQSDTLLRVSGLIDNLKATLQSGRAEIPQSTLKLKSRTNTFTGLAAFDDLIGKLENARAGEVYFAHILLPHTPYVVQSNCEPLPFGDWEDRDTSSSLQQRQRRYLTQIWCAGLKVNQALEALDRSPSARNYVAIVHGDHGSRLTKVDPDVAHRGKYDSDDLIAGFSTMFAIKANGVEPGNDRSPASAALLLKQFTAGEFRVAPEPFVSNGEVFLDDENWKPAGRETLPESWLKAR